MKTRQCPRCKSEDIVYEPWAGGQLWFCKNCGYKGPLVAEKED